MIEPDTVKINGFPVWLAIALVLEGYSDEQIASTYPELGRDGLAEAKDLFYNDPWEHETIMNEMRGDR